MVTSCTRWTVVWELQLDLILYAAFALFASVCASSGGIARALDFCSEVSFWFGRWLLLCGWHLFDFVSKFLVCAAFWANSGCVM